VSGKKEGVIVCLVSQLMFCFENTERAKIGKLTEEKF
jgi:hypothetical protein